MALPDDKLEILLDELYRTGAPLLDSFSWKFEEDRWAELLICSLPAAVGIDPVTARISVDTLKRMRVIAVDGLASLSPKEMKFIDQVFVKYGCAAADARKATKTIVSLAKVVKRNWDGYLQRFLRKHGEKMVKDLQAALKSAGMGHEAGAKIAVLWLQNVANIPILLPGDIYIRSF